MTKGNCQMDYQAEVLGVMLGQFFRITICFVFLLSYGLSETLAAAKDSIDFSNAYTVLGVRRDADEDEIWQAYLRRLHEFHPQSGRNPDITSFLAAQTAFAILKDQARRQAHDQLIDSGENFFFSKEAEDWVPDIPPPVFVLPKPNERLRTVGGISLEDIVRGSPSYFARIEDVLSEGLRAETILKGMIFEQIADAPAGHFLGRRGSHVARFVGLALAVNAVALSYHSDLYWLGWALLAAYPPGLNLTFKMMTQKARAAAKSDIHHMTILTSRLGGRSMLGESIVVFDFLDQVVRRLADSELEVAPTNATLHLLEFVQKNPEGQVGWLVRYMQWQRELRDKPGLKVPYWWKGFELDVRSRRSHWRRVARQMQIEASGDSRYDVEELAEDFLARLRPRATLPYWYSGQSAQLKLKTKARCERLLVSARRLVGKRPVPVR